MESDPAALANASTSRGPVVMRPVAVARPSSAEDVATIVRWAADAGLSLVPRGAATGMPGGNVGRGVALDLTALDQVAWTDGPEPFIQAGAGAVAAAVDRHACARDRRLPFLPSSATWCTVGGMVACNAAGARSFGFGATRAHVAGLEVVRADGTLEWLGQDADGALVSAGPSWQTLEARLRSVEASVLADWPAVAKNSSGYALDRYLATGDPVQLMVGSEGTLGVVTRVLLRTTRAPDRVGAVLVGLRTLDDLCETVSASERAGAAACEYFGAALLDLGAAQLGGLLEGLDTGAGAALVEFQGHPDLVEEGVARIERLAHAMGGCRVGRDAATRSQLWSVRHSASPTIAAAAGRGLRSLQFIEDNVVPSGVLQAYVGGVQDILERHATEAVIFGHAGDGNLHVNPLIDMTDARWLDRVRGILEETVSLVGNLGGTLAGEHGDGRIRAPYLERIWTQATASAFRQVKHALDPAAILNPGVILPLDGQDPLDGFGATAPIDGSQVLP